MEPDKSMRSQDPVSGAYPEAQNTSSHPNTLFPQDQPKYQSFICSWVFPMVSFLQTSQPTFSPHF